MNAHDERPVLEARGLTRRFGGLVAVDNFSFSVREGAIHGLIGPNGAGKTTTFNVISGFYAPSAGRVFFRGLDISGRKTSELAAMGLVRTFQGSTLFQEFSVLDNIRVGRHLGARGRFPQPAARHGPAVRAGSGRQGAGNARLFRAGGTGRRAGVEPAARPPAHARHGGCAGGGAESAASRRALHRHEPGGDPAHDGAGPAASARAASPSCWSSTTCRR